MCMQLLMLHLGYMLEEILSLTSSGHLFTYLFIKMGGGERGGLEGNGGEAFLLFRWVFSSFLSFSSFFLCPALDDPA